MKNERPLPEVLQESIRQLLSDAVEDMDGLNREIVKTQIRPIGLDQCLEGLQHQKAEDAAQICISHDTIYPLKNTPPEVLTEIFIYLSPGKMVLPPTKTSHPWTLTHVCTHWRNIVWTSPAISGSIQIEHFSRFRDYSKRMDGWNSIVHATFHHVLSVTRSPLRLDASSDRTCAAAVFDLVLSHSHRFQSLTLDLSQGSFESLMSLSQHSLKCLEHLDINISGQKTPSHYTTGLKGQIITGYSPINHIPDYSLQMLSRGGQV